VLLITAKPSAAIGNQLKSRLVFVHAELPCGSGSCCWVTGDLGPTATHHCVTNSTWGNGTWGSAQDISIKEIIINFFYYFYCFKPFFLVPHCLNKYPIWDSPNIRFCKIKHLKHLDSNSDTIFKPQLPVNLQSF